MSSLKGYIFITGSVVMVNAEKTWRKIIGDRIQGNLLQNSLSYGCINKTGIIAIPVGMFTWKGEILWGSTSRKIPRGINTTGNISLNYGRVSLLSVQ